MYHKAETVSVLASGQQGHCHARTWVEAFMSVKDMTSWSIADDVTAAIGCVPELNLTCFEEFSSVTCLQCFNWSADWQLIS